MRDRFDELSRAIARPASRRSALKALGGAAATAAVATVLRPFRASAAPCPAGATACGTGCCAKGESCSNARAACCCPAGTSPCGLSCCKKGVACVDRARGICGCPSGMTPCGSGENLTCCAAGTTCSPSNATCTPVASHNTIAKQCEPPPFTPPAVCTTGEDPETGDEYVVCQSSTTEAWVSSAKPGNFHAQQICQLLGYSSLGQFGGTCGNVCGFCEEATSCSSPGTKTFDGKGNCGTDANGLVLCFTVQWQCLASTP